MDPAWDLSYALISFEQRDCEVQGSAVHCRVSLSLQMAWYVFRSAISAAAGSILICAHHESSSKRSVIVMAVLQVIHAL